MKTKDKTDSLRYVAGIIYSIAFIFLFAVVVPITAQSIQENNENQTCSITR
jgi:uncharacterized protein YoxC